MPLGSFKSGATALSLSFLVLASSCGSPGDNSDGAVPTGALSVRHVRVFDANGVLEDQHVVIGSGRILSIEPDDGALSVGEEIDGTGATLIPGLWDSHVHLHVQGIPAEAAQVGNQAPENLRASLYSGVTTVVDMATIPAMFTSARGRGVAGELRIPRIKGVGPGMTVPGGHPCNGFYSREVCAFIDGVGTVPPLVGSIVALAPDALKVVIEGGIPSIPLPRITAAEILAVSDEAMAAGIPLFAHVSSEADAADAVAAGVNAIAHAPIEDVLDPMLIADFATAGTAVVSTLSFTDAWHRFADSPQWLGEPLVVGASPPLTLASLTDPGLHSTISAMTLLVDTARAYTDMAMQNVYAFSQAGVPILAGTDAGNPFVLHGVAMHRELELLVAAGLSTTEALAAATLNPARFFGEDAGRGLVAVDYVADLVLVDGDPSQNIYDTTLIREVWLAGERIDRAALDASMGIQNIIVAPRALGESEFCVDDIECGAGLACSSFFRICRETCSPAGPPTCPAGYGCVSAGAIGLCIPADPCDVALQDCPFPGEYALTCVAMGGANFCL